MATNVVIGIGGTGAKVVEAVLHTATAGLITENLVVGLVDQDGANGNVAQTDEVLHSLIDARNVWRGQARPHRLGKSPLFATHIKALSDRQAVWVPHPDKRSTLARIFGREQFSPEERLLFDGLFVDSDDPDLDEQQLPLEEGYRGRPHIGAAAMASRGGEDPFWEQLNQILDDATGSKEVRILLAGSVFGGAGASGFPTIARLITGRVKRGKNLKIGGVLMLPYFDFDPAPKSTDDDEETRRNVVKSEELALQAKSALKHYVDLLETEGLFDQLYLVGWDRPFALGYHSRGSNSQTNPPLAPEVLAALAGARFFQTRFDDEEDKVLVCARKSQGALTWSDLPSPIDEDGDAPRKAFGQLLRFAVAWKYWASLVGKPKSGLSSFKTDTWARRQKVNEIKYNITPVEDEVSALDAYVNKLLAWAGAIRINAEAAGLDLRLWDTDGFLSRPTKPYEPVGVPAGFDGTEFAKFYDRLIVSGEGVERLPSTADQIKRLTDEAEDDHGQEALGRFVSALHAYSTVTTSQQGA